VPGIFLALYLGTVDSACEIYWNGRLVGGIAKLPPHPVWYQSNYSTAEMLLGQNASGVPLGRPEPGVLAIRVWKAPTILFSSPKEGGLIAVPQAGSAEAIAALPTGVQYRWLRQNQFSFAVLTVSSMAGFICLLVGLNSLRRNDPQRDRTLLFWLAIVLISPSIFFLFNDVPGLIPFRWNYGLIGILIGIYDAAIWFVLLDLLGLRQNRRLLQWTRFVVAVLWTFDVLDGVLQLFDWSGVPQRFLPWDTAFTLLAVPAEFWGAVLVLFAFRRRLTAASWALAISAFAANLVQALADLGDMGVRWTH
jgi:hypothetical protein